MTKNSTQSRKVAKAQSDAPKKKLFGCQTHELTGTVTALRQEMDLPRLEFGLAVEVTTGEGKTALVRLPPSSRAKLSLGARVKIIVIIQ